MVVGQVRTNRSYSSARAFVWQSGKGRELNTTRGTLSYAFAVNERGQRFGQLLGFMADARTHKEEEGEQAAYDQNVNDRDCAATALGKFLDPRYRRIY